MRNKTHHTQLQQQIDSLMQAIDYLRKDVGYLLDSATTPTPTPTPTPAVRVRKAVAVDKAGMRWTTEEDQLLLALWEKATPQPVMGTILGRSDKSVSVRLSKIRMGRA